MIAIYCEVGIVGFEMEKAVYIMRTDMIGGVDCAGDRTLNPSCVLTPFVTVSDGYS